MCNTSKIINFNHCIEGGWFNTSRDIYKKIRAREEEFLILLYKCCSNSNDCLCSECEDIYSKLRAKYLLALIDHSKLVQAEFKYKNLTDRLNQEIKDMNMLTNELESL